MLGPTLAGLPENPFHQFNDVDVLHQRKLSMDERSHPLEPHHRSKTLSI